ncbi:MAG: hypothetical protein HC769_10230 [Cyanobacteria bacterium CRU_2_1]|nr:hypothetical protein [Cyanobacteria bacterium CRU_2_1]
MFSAILQAHVSIKNLTHPIARLRVSWSTIFRIARSLSKQKDILHFLD